jgi:hypothetical protein
VKNTIGLSLASNIYPSRYIPDTHQIDISGLHLADIWYTSGAYPEISSPLEADAWLNEYLNIKSTR